MNTAGYLNLEIHNKLHNLKIDSVWEEVFEGQGMVKEGLKQ
jgi:hypothetical protein